MAPLSKGSKCKPKWTAYSLIILRQIGFSAHDIRLDDSNTDVTGELPISAIRLQRICGWIYERTVTLQENIDRKRVEAILRDGVLDVVLA